MSNVGSDTEGATEQDLSSTVLVVEDESFSRQLFKMILEDDRHKYIGVETLAEARSYLEKNLPDLIVLDVMLPERNGFDVCKDLRDRKIATPILMLTAKGQEIDGLMGFTYLLWASEGRRS